jgi:HEAT repeat protein
MLVQSALTVWTLTGDESAVAPIVRTLHDGETYARVDAAAALRDFATPVVEDALYEAVDDPDKLVRANAVDSLLAQTGLGEWDTVAGRGIGLLGLRLRSRFASVRRDAIADLRRLASAKRAGATPAELGLPVGPVERSAAATRVQQSIISKAGTGPWAQDFDLEALGQLTGDEREWAVYSLLLLLERGDARAVRALVAMNAEEAREPLRELAGDASGDLAVAIERGLASLRGRAN